MADRVRKVAYFKVRASNSAGQGARLLEGLQEEGVNLLAFSGFPRNGRAQIDFVPENTGTFLKAARKLGLTLSKKKAGFLVQGQDRIGAVGKTMRKLADARINVTAIDALCAGKGRFGAILWVKPAKVSKAARVLRAS
ncbi:MAG TPA: hypothetical protein VIU33_03495 [Nitrospiria bacterium]